MIKVNKKQVLVITISSLLVLGYLGFKFSTKNQVQATFTGWVSADTLQSKKHLEVSLQDGSTVLVEVTNSYIQLGNQKVSFTSFISHIKKGDLIQIGKRILSPAGEFIAYSLIHR